MKKILLAATLLLCLNTVLSAQSVISIQPIPATTSGTMDDVDVEADAQITNLTANLVHLKWERTEINLTAGIETAVCDPVTCWSRTTSTKDFDLDPNESGQLLVHFYANGITGSGIIRLKVTNLDNPSDSTIAIYKYNISSRTNDLPVATVKLFPNPATHYFSLENATAVATLRLFNIDGREVARFEAASSNVYSIENQPAGNYILALEDKDGQLFQAVELKKQ